MSENDDDVALGTFRLDCVAARASSIVSGDPGGKRGTGSQPKLREQDMQKVDRMKSETSTSAYKILLMFSAVWHNIYIYIHT